MKRLFVLASCFVAWSVFLSGCADTTHVDGTPSEAVSFGGLSSMTSIEKPALNATRQEQGSGRSCAPLSAPSCISPVP